jgi:Ni/Co efflux regulator RcnB
MSLNFSEQATALQKIVLTALMVLAVPTVSMAQREEHHGRPAPGEFRGPRPGRPPGPGQFRGPRPGGQPGRFSYHGRPFNRVHVAPFVYPRGWAYQRWAIGAVLPPLFLAPAYYYSGWAALGLPPPQPGFQWVRYGPDLLLVNVTTGQVVDTIYGAFY